MRLPPIPKFEFCTSYRTFLFQTLHFFRKFSRARTVQNQLRLYSPYTKLQNSVHILPKINRPLPKFCPDSIQKLKHSPHSKIDLILPLFKIEFCTCYTLHHFLDFRDPSIQKLCQESLYTYVFIFLTPMQKLFHTWR